jgi:hypothetical protein
MPIPTVITDHVTQAQARLVGPIKQAPRLNSLINGVVAQIQEIETMFFEIMTKRILATCVAAQLDGIGEIVGLERLYLQDDTSYRADLRSWILFIRSQGAPETIINVVSRFTDSLDTQFVEYPPASAIITFEGTPYSETRIAYLAEASAAAGVRIDAVKRDDSNPFVFFGDPDGNGFGTTTNPATGGRLSHVMGV